MENVIIRFAEEDDSKALLDIYTWYAKHTDITWDKNPPSLEHFKEKLNEIKHNFPYILCQVDNKTVGYAYISLHSDSEEKLWTTIYILDEFRGHRIGRALYTCLFEIANMQGIDEVSAIVSNANEASVKFHERFGFVKTGSFPGALIMSKKLHTEKTLTRKKIDELDAKKIDELFRKTENIVKKTLIV